MKDEVSEAILDASSLLSTFNKLESLDLQPPHVDFEKCETELDLEIAMRDFLIWMYKSNEKDIKILLRSPNPKLVERAKKYEEEQKERLEKIKEKEKRIEELKNKKKKQEELEYQKRQEALRIRYEKQWAKWRK